MTDAQDVAVRSEFVSKTQKHWNLLTNVSIADGGQTLEMM